MSNYPDGMSRQDLIHVGEIDDGYEDYYENYEPSFQQLADWLEDNAEKFLQYFMKPPAGLTPAQLDEFWKEEHSQEIYEQFIEEGES